METEDNSYCYRSKAMILFLHTQNLTSIWMITPDILKFHWTTIIFLVAFRTVQISIINDIIIVLS